MKPATTQPNWADVLDFWFPEDEALELDAATHRQYWIWRMRGGADTEIISRFSEIATRAAEGRLEGWASQPQGRLGLIIALDQFSRSVWRGTAQAYAQDTAALSLTLGGIANGHYAALSKPWHKIVFGLPLGHCESPDHLDRIDLLITLRQDLLTEAPAGLRPIYETLVQQARTVRQVIAAFGRHPHRNSVLARPTTPAEEVYVAAGQFPHLRAFENES